MKTSAIKLTMVEDAALMLSEPVSAPARAKMLELLADAFVDNLPEQQLWLRLATIIDGLSPRGMRALADRFQPPSADDWFRDGLKLLVAHHGPGGREAARLICREHIRDIAGDDPGTVIVQICEQLDDTLGQRLVADLSAVYALDLAGSRN